MKMKKNTYCKGLRCVVPIFLAAKAKDVEMCSNLNKWMGEDWSPGQVQFEKNFQQMIYF